MLKLSLALYVRPKLSVAVITRLCVPFAMPPGNRLTWGPALVKIALPSIVTVVEVMLPEEGSAADSMCAVPLTMELALGWQMRTPAAEGAAHCAIAWLGSITITKTMATKTGKSGDWHFDFIGYGLFVARMVLRSLMLICLAALLIAIHEPTLCFSEMSINAEKECRTTSTIGMPVLIQSRRQAAMSQTRLVGFCRTNPL
jgi:hypothetical protein